MKTKNSTIALIILVTLSSCSITRMRYTKGLNIELFTKNKKFTQQIQSAKKAVKKSRYVEDINKQTPNIANADQQSFDSINPTKKSIQENINIQTIPSKKYILHEKLNTITNTHFFVHKQTSTPINSTNKSDKTRLAAYILCTYFGWLGIHRFYLGYTTIGIIQMFTFGGFFIWWFIDLIRILLNDLKPKNEDYVP